MIYLTQIPYTAGQTKHSDVRKGVNDNLEAIDSKLASLTAQDTTLNATIATEAKERYNQNIAQENEYRQLIATEAKERKEQDTTLNATIATEAKERYNQNIAQENEYRQLIATEAKERKEQDIALTPVCMTAAEFAAIEPKESITYYIVE